LTLFESPFWQTKKLEQAVLSRSSALIPKYQVFSAPELASLWHPPGLTLSNDQKYILGCPAQSDPPENLPVSSDSEEEKKLINFFRES